MIYDAIVVGTGITGGWAAKELCEAGLKTLVLDRGRDIQHGDYPTANMDKWEFPNNSQLSLEELKEYPVQRRVNFINHANKHLFVKDTDHPYHEEYPFTWIRGDHVGGRSLMWGRQVYRWSDVDFEANAREGIGVDWPIRYKDLEFWYAYVEKFIGVSGKKEGLRQLPDGEFLPPMEMTAVEKYFTQQVSEKYDDRIVTIGRVANLTQKHNGREQCQYRNRCIRGCPYGAYFSSQSSTLPSAFATGNMELRPHSLVKEILFDDDTQKATGVRVIDAVTRKETEYFAKIIFLNASTIGSTQILLQSKSSRFPNGMGNDSGELGHNLMDHHSYVGAIGFYDQLLDRYYRGRRPNNVYIPRFQNLDERTRKEKFIRGYNFSGYSRRENWFRPVPGMEYGTEFKNACMQPGRWELSLIAYGECLPYHDNEMYLHPSKKDHYGLPQAAFKMEWKENEFSMRESCQVEAAEMLEKSGFKDVQMSNNGKNPGATIHEMGTARMGRDPKTSVLNEWNQIHAVKNVFVTDGSCMTSSACQNPSLTYMALTTRAADYAISKLKKGEL